MGANMSRFSPYKGTLTREQFLFYEMRATAKLMLAGLSDKEIIKRIEEENLFQYPTEKMLRNLAQVCVRRLHGLEDESLVEAIATQASDVAKQICLYAIMRQQRIVWDFMISVVGEKYRTRDTAFSKMDINVFILRLQEQDDLVASWSDSTIAKMKQVMLKLLVENEYLDSTKATRLNPVWLQPQLENAIRAHGDEIALSAFNCFS